MAKRKRTQPRLEPTRKDAVETRARLLEAARQVWARHGFHDAGLREICKAAGVNLGSVRYYFGSKEELYREVLVESHRQLVEAEPLPRLADAPDVETALRQWLGYFLRLVLIRRPAHPAIGRLVLHEMARPTPALDELVSLVMRPVRKELERIIRALAGDRAGRADVGKLVNFTMLLCVMHEIARPVLERFGYPPPRDERTVEQLADAIFRFTLGGVRSLAASGRRGSRKHA